ncbi:MAG TPA: molybdate ABC transporter substrate-binding protein [Acidimicrobiales bacterium]
MKKLTLLVLAMFLLVATACGDDSGDDGGGDAATDTTTDSGGESQELLVLAASSLTNAFTAMEPVFEDAHPGVDVVLTFDSSSTLAGQVAEGGPAGVLATADENNMATAVDSGNVSGEPVIFTSNSGVIAVPAGSDTVTAPEDLQGDIVLAVCAPEVPCRVVADEMFAQLGIDPEIDSEEENVAAVVTKLEADEVDAGVVYVTDDIASDDIEAIDIGAVVVTTEYPIVAVSDDEAAQAFVDFVSGPEGQSLLTEAGFVAP